MECWVTQSFIFGVVSAVISFRLEQHRMEEIEHDHTMAAIPTMAQSKTAQRDVNRIFEKL